MLKSDRLVFTCLTHTAALLVGWGGWTAFQHGGAEHGKAAPATSTKSRQRPTDEAKSLGEILAIISPKTPDRLELILAAAQAQHATLTAEFDELLKTMVVPDDLKEAVEAELKLVDKKPYLRSAKMAVLMYFWACEDCPGLLKWADRSDRDKFQVLVNHMEVITQKLIAEQGLKSVVGFLNHPDWEITARNYATTAAGKSPDLHELSEVKAQLDLKRWRDFSSCLLQYWPWAEKSKLVKFAVSENDPSMISRLASEQGKNDSWVGTWLLELITDETLDAGFREKLAKDGGVKMLATSDWKLPLAQRIALLQGDDPANPSGQMPFDQLAINDVNGALNESEDWCYEFRHGKVEADEVLAAVSARLPELTGVSPEAVRNALFLNLVEEDSGRAMQLLKDLPPEARAKAVLDAAQTALFQVDPERFFATLQQVPEDNPDLWDARLDAWVMHGPDNYRRFNTKYVEWVRALPDGVDRDMALCSLAMASGEDNPSLAAELRNEVKSEKLKQKAGGSQ